MAFCADLSSTYIEQDETARLLMSRNDPRIKEPYVATCADKVSGGLNIITWVAIIIIGSIGIAGLLPGSTMGWCAIGMGVGTLASRLISDKTRSSCGYIVIALAVTLALVTIGSLGVTGSLTATQVGWGLVGTSLVGIGIKVLDCCCCGGCDSGPPLELTPEEKERIKAHVAELQG